MSAEPATTAPSKETPFPTPPPSTTFENLLLLIPLLILIVGTAFLCHLGIFSSGVWEGGISTQVHHLRTGTSLYSELLDRPRDMPPRVVAFYSESCPACRKLRQVFRDAAEGEGAEFVAVNVKGEGLLKLAHAFEVTHTPTVIYVEGRGKDFIMERYQGKATLAGLREFVNSFSGADVSVESSDAERTEL